MDWYQGLNPEQQQAVAHNEGPLLILAGAGSGKTTVLVSRTGRLISEKIVKPENICVLTFTNKAARELKHRVKAKVGRSADRIWGGTFHSFGLYLLRKYHEKVGLGAHFGVIDQTDSVAIIKELLKNNKNSTKDKFDSDKLLSLIHELRVYGKCLNPDQEEYLEMAEMLLPKYKNRLEALGVVDFEELLLKPLELFNAHSDVLFEVQQQFQYLMVDEFQDTNLTQMDLVMKVTANSQNLAVVGDDDQSIYGWRGAEVKNILDFPKKFKKCAVIKLERNYRSSAEILSVANTLISHNKKRHGKTLKAETNKKNKKLNSLHSEDMPEIFILDNDEEEADFVTLEIQNFLKRELTYKDIAVLYRSNTQGAMIESALRYKNIPYKISGGTSLFDRKEIKDILAFLKLSVHPDEVSLRRVINTPARGIGETSIAKITEYAKKHNISFITACKRVKDIGLGEKIEEALLSFLRQIDFIPTRILRVGNPNIKVKSILFSSATAEGSKDYELNKSIKYEQTKFLDTQAQSGLTELGEYLKQSHTIPKTVDSSFGNALLNFLTEMGYRDYVYQSYTDPKTAEFRWVSIEILARILETFLNKGDKDFNAFKDFIDAMLLRDDPSDDEQKDMVQLMTLHASKGLEFPAVVITGIEEDLLPHKKLGSDIDEERRLFYVGITRAKDSLVMCRCTKRKKMGVVKPVTPSRFLLEIPKTMLREYPNGTRPVSGVERDSLVANFLAGLDNKDSKGAPK